MSAPAPNTVSNSTTSTTSSTNATTNASTELLPGSKVLLTASKLAIEQDKAIMLDYYRESANKTAFLAEDPKTKERVLIKSKEEFTSLVSKLYKVDEDFIVVTENSLYIVSGKLDKRSINLASLYEAYESHL